VTMGLAKPITEFETVKTWGEGLRKQWGGDPLAEEPEMVDALAKFCDFVGEDPDSIVARLFRIRKEDGARVLSVKWRRHYADKVKEFRAQCGGEKQRRGADVLSFMIHNGVLIQG
jgi:hypothetical protein